MTKIDYEAEYNNRRRVPEHETIAARWAAASAKWREEADLLADQSYGPGERQRYDLFRARNAANAPLVVYIHGGYWQRGDRKAQSFLAKEFNKRGIDVALPSYSLAPTVTVAAIVTELRQCLKTLYQRTKKRPVVVGHSAGGHLAAAMLATDWSTVGDVPNDLVRDGAAQNRRMQLRAANAITGRKPSPSAIMVAAVGGDESQEFIRQSLALAAAWSAAGVKAECVVVPNANHFTMLDELARPESAVLARVVSLANS